MVTLEWPDNRTYLAQVLCKVENVAPRYSPGLARPHADHLDSAVPSLTDSLHSLVVVV